MADLSTRPIPEQLISTTDEFDADTPITKITPLLKQHAAVVINKHKRYYGIIDSRTIYRHEKGMRLSETQKAEVFTARATPINEHTPISDIANYFYKQRVKALPYSKKGKLKGILKRTTLLKVLLSYGVLSSIKVSSVMSTPLLAIDINSSVPQAKAAMVHGKANKLAVLRGSEFAGIITNHDIVGEYTPLEQRRPQIKDEKRSPLSITLASALEPNPITIEHNKSLSDAARAMLEHHVSSLIVLSNKRPVGMLSMLDVLEGYIASSAYEAANIYISGLDASTYEYGDETREELRAFLKRISSLRQVDPYYISLRVKRIKTRGYDMHIRLATSKNMYIASATDYLFDRTLNEVLAKLEKEITKRHGKLLAIRKVTGYEEPEEE